MSYVKVVHVLVNLNMFNTASKSYYWLSFFITLLLRNGSFINF